jgi:hypothetical protein
MVDMPEVDAIFKKIDILEKKIMHTKIQIIHSEAAKESFEKKISRDPKNKEELNWMMMCIDYVSFHLKKSMNSRYWLKKYTLKLEELKTNIDNKGDLL